MKDLKIFSGSSNPALTRAICKAIGVPMGNSECGAFSDGESFASIYETVRGSDVYVVQSTCATGKPGDEGYHSVNDYLMEMLIMLDALKRASAGRITAVLPYFGYARQDRKTKPRDPISARLVSDLLTKAGADHVLTMDIHCLQIQGFFDIPMDNLQGGSLFVEYFKKKFADSYDNTMVVSPDVGSVARVRNFAQQMNMPMAIVDKRRQKANSSEVMNIIGDVKDKNVILLDDMVDTAGSLCGAAKALMTIGGAKSVTACASHGVLSGPAMERIDNSFLDELVLLDTIPAPKDLSSKIHYLTVAPMFAEAISRMFNDASMNAIYS
ncbi:MAG: ribose-phosphate pyrophosphokinase [Clostridiales bacterium]|nr:ribose-phosphate pyrophosphokinase [Clostridiales bacterium]